MKESSVRRLRPLRFLLRHICRALLYSEAVVYAPGDRGVKGPPWACGCGHYCSGGSKPFSLYKRSTPVCGSWFMHPLLNHLDVPARV